MMCPPSKAGIGKKFINASIIESNAVVSQKACQFQYEGNNFPIVPKPPNCDTPSLVKMYLNCPM